MITIYSKISCPHCDNAKRYLESKNINYKEINIEQDDEAREFISSKGHRTVPQIYFGTELLIPGGWQALAKLSQEEIINRINNINLGTI
jgi:glutaredoxin